MMQNIISITFNGIEDYIRVEAVAATEITFEIDTNQGPLDYAEIVADVCGVLPPLLRADMDTAEMYDNAGRTTPNSADLHMIAMFRRKYAAALNVIECDLLEA
jgi:hypothetical protein